MLSSLQNHVKRGKAYMHPAEGTISLLGQLAFFSESQEDFLSGRLWHGTLEVGSYIDRSKWAVHLDMGISRLQSMSCDLQVSCIPKPCPRPPGL